MFIISEYCLLYSLFNHVGFVVCDNEFWFLIMNIGFSIFEHSYVYSIIYLFGFPNLRCSSHVANCYPALAILESAATCH